MLTVMFEMQVFQASSNLLPASDGKGDDVVSIISLLNNGITNGQKNFLAMSMGI
jgi:hypothetical protein